MLASKAWKEPGAPASSAWAYGMFVRANSIVLVGGGVLLTMVMGIAFELYIVGVIGIGAAVIATLVACVPMVVASIAVSVVYGQCGSRVFLRMQTSDAMLVDDDDHWKLGIFSLGARRCEPVRARAIRRGLDHQLRPPWSMGDFWRSRCACRRFCRSIDSDGGLGVSL